MGATERVFCRQPPPADHRAGPDAVPGLPGEWLREAADPTAIDHEALRSVPLRPPPGIGGGRRTAPTTAAPGWCAGAVRGHPQSTPDS